MRRWTRGQDRVNAVAGAWLFITPWVYGNYGLSSWNAWLLGGAMLIVSLWALAAPESAAVEWINAVFGAWTFVAPWALGFVALSTVAGRAIAWNAWVVGVGVLALWALSERTRELSKVRQGQTR